MPAFDISMCWYRRWITFYQWFWNRNDPAVLCFKNFQNQAKSAKQIKELQNLQENKKKAIKSEKRADTTRWMILEVTVDGVSKEYLYLIHAFRGLQQDLKSGNVSKNMLKKIDNIKLLSTAYILKFMLPHPKTI